MCRGRAFFARERCAPLIFTSAPSAHAGLLSPQAPPTALVPLSGCFSKRILRLLPPNNASSYESAAFA
jgi:hypothetical protein